MRGASFLQFELEEKRLVKLAKRFKEEFAAQYVGEVRSEAFFDALLAAVAAHPTLGQVRVATGNQYGADAFTCFESHDFDLRAANRKAQADEGEDWKEDDNDLTEGSEHEYGGEDDNGDGEEEDEGEEEVSEEEDTIGASPPRTQMFVPDGTEPVSPSSGASSSSPLCHGTPQPSYASGQQQDIRDEPSSQPLSTTGDALPSQGSDAAELLLVLLDTRHCDEELASLTSSLADAARRKELLSQCPNVDRRCIVCRQKDRNPRQRRSAVRDTLQPTMYPFCESCENKGRVCNIQSCGKKPLTGYALYLKSSSANKYGGKTVSWWIMRANCNQCNSADVTKRSKAKKGD